MSVPALILAGGLGTRLRGVLPDLPKALAPINGRPFLRYLLDRLEQAGAPEVILCTGHRHESIRDELERCPIAIPITYSHELRPLGTGGAVRQALEVTAAERFLVLNGDSFTDCDLNSFIAWGSKFPAALVLTHVDDAARFGTVMTNEQDQITAFCEKQGASVPGWINAGIYLLTRSLLSPLPAGRACSIEKDLFPQWLGHGLGAYRVNAPFIDIGTPESLAQASRFLATVGAS